MAEFKPNEDQIKFLESHNKSVLVSASAGSGKTSTMIQKILHLLVSNYTPITNFMVVTYTNAAAGEIKQKLYNAITEKINQVESIKEKNFLKNELDNLNNAEIGTLHAICKKLIIKYFYEVGQSPDFKLLSEKDAKYLFESAIDKIFKKHISIDDSEFFDLYDCYNSKRSDENLKSIIIKLQDFLNTKTDVDAWKTDFLNSSYDLSLNSNGACTLILDYYISKFNKLRYVVNSLLEKRSILNLDKYTAFLQSRYHLIDAFCASKNFEQAVKIIDNYVADRKPAKSKNADIDELEFDSAVSDFASDIKALVDNFKKDIVSTDIKLIKSSLSNSKNNLLKLLDITNEVNEEYKILKASRNSLDFNDLENIMCELLSNASIKDTLANSYKYIFVDEYQDINEKQENILNQLLKDNEYFMIGDVKQSIYAFRQSSPKIFISKYAKYSLDGVENAVINFNTNYRSEKNILEFANLVFDKLITLDTIGIDYSKDARFKSEKALSSERVYLKLIDATEGVENKEEKEALVVANTILDILTKYKTDGSKYDYKDIAIILRSRGTYVKTLCDTLSRMQIPVVAQVRNDFYNTTEIQIMINLLKCISNYRNDVPLVSVLKNLFDFSEEELIEIKNSSEEKFFYDKVINYQADNNISDKLKKFFEFLSKCNLELTYKSIYNLLCDILDEYGLLLQIKSWPNGIERANNIKDFLELADNENYEYSLDKFLEYLDFASKENSLQTVGSAGNAVQICTIHHSKGLEYPAVILSGMGRKFQTNKDSSEIIINNTYGVGLKSIDRNNRSVSETIVRNACKIDNLKKELDEEIRLLYVAMTRAREYLYMIGSYDLSSVSNLHKISIYNCSCYLDMILKSFDKSYMPFFENKTEFKIYETKDCSADIEIIKIKDIEEKVSNSSSQMVLSSIDDKLLKSLSDIKNNIPNLDTFTIKNTVTNILMEEKDYENINFIPEKLEVSDKTPDVDSLKLGTAYHMVMQYVNFTENEEAVEELISTLIGSNLISKDIAKLISPSEIVACINNLKPLILKAKSIYKEKQFLLQESYNKLVKNSDNNTKVIVQGVIDTVLIFENDAYLIDYKTNKTSNEEFLKNNYRLQLEIYKLAFEKATNIKITKKFLYSFHLNKLIEVI